MTKSIINNLNIFPEKSVNQADKLPKTEGIDFGTIFETKTNKTAEESQKVTVTNETQITSETEITNNIADKLVVENTDNIEDENISETDTLSDLQITISDLNENVIEVCAEYNFNLNVIDNLQIQDSTECTENIEDSSIETTVDTEIEKQDETIITEEAPTMYKNELNTLENPTTLFVMQSQIQKIVSTSESNQDDVNTDSLNMQNSNNNLNNSAGMFKQFDNTVPKDTLFVQTSQNTQAKENIHTKTEDSKISKVINENVIKELNIEVVSDNTSSEENSMSDLMQNQSPQEQVARVMIQGDIKYEAIASEVAKNIQTKTVNISPSKIIDQITKQMEGMYNSSKLNIVLNPESLGKINLQMINSKDGLIAQFTVTTQEAKDILMKGLDGLKEGLLAQGVSVDNLSIRLEESESESKFDWSEQEGSRGGNKNRETKKQKENEVSFEQIMGNKEEEESIEV